VQLRPHLAAGVRIERSHRLVEQEHAWVPRERTSNGDSLPLASGKLGRLCLRKVLDAQTPQKAVGAPAAEGHVSLDAEMREERVLLEHEADRPLFRTSVDPLRRVEPDIACAGDRAARGMRETRDRTQHGRLAGSRRADERDRLAADVER